MTDVRRSFLLSFADNYLAIALQIASTVVIARLLTPAEVGVFAIAAVFSALASSFRDFGFAEYLIQARDLDHAKIRAALGMNIIVSWAMAATLFFAAPAPERFVRPAALDFGPDIERGIAVVPPKAGAQYKVYVSAIDADGNEAAGIRLPDVAVPLATVTGWNPRHPDQGAPGDLMQMMGSTLPFARTRAEREQRGDPRLSIAERYASRAAYLEAAREAAQKLVAARYLLAEDIESIVERAGKRWEWVHALG